MNRGFYVSHLDVEGALQFFPSYPPDVWEGKNTKHATFRKAVDWWVGDPLVVRLFFQKPVWVTGEYVKPHTDEARWSSFVMLDTDRDRVLNIRGNKDEIHCIGLPKKKVTVVTFNSQKLHWINPYEAEGKPWVGLSLEIVGWALVAHKALTSELKLAMGLG